MPAGFRSSLHLVAVYFLRLRSKRREVASTADGRRSSKTEYLKPTTADIGLTSKQIHNARQVRDAEERDPGVVRRTLDNEIKNRGPLFIGNRVVLLSRAPTMFNTVGATQVSLRKFHAIAALCGDGLRPELQALFKRLAIQQTELFVREDGMTQSGPDPKSEDAAMLDKTRAAN